MTEMIPPSDETIHPLVGRDSVYARLQQHILDPAHRHALVYTGHAGMGKSAILAHFPRIFPDSLLSVQIPLNNLSSPTLDSVLQQLTDAIDQVLLASNFSMSRVPELGTETNLSLSVWFRETYLPEVMHIIRPHRRLVWLIDDAEQLQQFDADFIVYWQDLLQIQQQFAIVMTISTAYEDQLGQLHPLVNPVLAERLHRLTLEDVSVLMRYYAPGIDDEKIATIHRATGGHPRLLHYYGTALHATWANQTDTQAFKAAQAQVYAKSHSDFRQLWQRLSRDERLVLTAIASLIYADPLADVTAQHIEGWLVETDYLLDIVTINAALRSLDYQDIVRHRQGESIALTMQLMQHWLLEQARLDDEVGDRRGVLSWPIVLLAIVIIGVIVALLFLIPPAYLDGNSAIATATLDS